LETNIQDGVNGVTECPLAPGKSKVYKLRATQYGTTWYHSHTSIQYGNGVWGTIHIDGPASANYDIDLGVYPIGDYYYRGADEILPDTTTAGPPASDNVLFNGTNINPLVSGLGAYDVVTLTSGSVHRLRLINPSVENNFQVTLVGHTLTVIATDLVPVEPLVVDTLYLGIGQRYDVLIDASAAVDSYWFNVTYATGAALGLCGASNNPQPASIFRYDGAADALPTDPGTAPVSAECQDRVDFVPVVVRTADETNLLSDAADPAHNQAVALNFTIPFTWTVNSSAVNVDWDMPVLSYVLEGNTSYPRSENLIFTNEDDGVWTYWVIQNTSPLPHPMHLHGHDFLVLGHGSGTFTTADADSLNFANPTRRDVTMLPANGYLILAFLADNPGNWLFHCHIAWHVSGGLAADFMERPDEQAALISADDLAQYNQVCEWWTEYSPPAPPKPDSGI
jgi:FtsP/CotA-like multicopper oxidase with cupredoxin domain